MFYEKKWHDKEESQLHLRLEGQLQFGKFKDLQSFIFSLKEKPPKHITFDLCDVDLIDSSGLGLLIIANEITGKANNITLQYPSEQVGQILQICKIDEIMEVVV